MSHRSSLCRAMGLAPLLGMLLLVVLAGCASGGTPGAATPAATTSGGNPVRSPRDRKGL